MKAWQKRYADDLERPGVASRELGQVKGFDARLAGQQRYHARLHIVLIACFQGFWQRSPYIGRRHLARNFVLVVALHLAEPGNDLRIACRLQIADLAGT